MISQISSAYCKSQLKQNPEATDVITKITGLDFKASGINVGRKVSTFSESF